MTSKISEKNKKDWEKFISGDEKLPNKDNKLKKKKSLNIRTIDLHGYTLDQANKIIYDFITNSYENKINNDLIKKIIEIKDANIEDGGSGAFYIYLRKKT